MALTDAANVDRVLETTTTTGTGTLTLAGAVSGYTTFDTSGKWEGGHPIHYVIEHQSAVEWEVGIGQLVSGNLTRVEVTASSNAGALVNLSAGTKNVFATLTAFQLNQLTPRGYIMAAFAPR